MRPTLILFSLLLFACATANKPMLDRAGEERKIREMLHQQQNDWNAGNIDGFMEGYWKSDSLQFIGSQVTKGWQETKDRYKKSYPTKEIMGQLTFTFYDFNFISADACLVTGRFQLHRASDDPTGMFTLLLRKFNGQWVIVSDHTS